MPSTAKRSDIPPDATAIRQFGEHLTWCERPDTLHLWLTGTLDGKDLHAVHEWIKEWANARRYNFVFCDMSNLGTVTREARKVMNERNNVAESQVTTVAYGANFTVRVLADMAHRARAAMGITETSPTIFVGTEADARALRDQLRRQYA